jgi:hypothetical protein
MQLLISLVPPSNEASEFEKQVCGVIHFLNLFRSQIRNQSIIHDQIILDKCQIQLVLSLPRILWIDKTLQEISICDRHCWFPTENQDSNFPSQEDFSKFHMKLASWRL